MEAGQWKAAVKMWRRAGAWEDVVRVAKQHGGPAAAKQVAYAWAVHLEVCASACFLCNPGIADV